MPRFQGCERPVRFLVLLALPWLVAGGARAGRGGPDAGGWMWADSNESGIDDTTEAPTAFTTITDPWPDEAVFPVDLSFPVTLYGVTSSRVWLSSNGWLSLVDPGVSAHALNRPLPDGAAPNALLAYLWDDLAAGASSFAQHGPTPNGHVILVRHFQPSSGATVQVWIWFHRNGSIKVIYQGAGDVATASVGIENELGDAGTGLAFDGALTAGFAPTTGYAVLFYPTSTPQCAASGPIACGDRVTGSTSGGGTLASGYGCSGNRYFGRDTGYRFDLASMQQVSIALTGLGARDQDAFLLRDGCDGYVDCVAGGGDTVTFPLVTPGSYRVVVDGRTPVDDGAFTLDVSCSAIDSPITCGATVSGTTNGVSGIDAYNCAGSGFTGAERLYTFTLPTAQAITASVTSPSGHGVILANQSDIAPGISPCIKGGSGELAAMNLPPGTYTLIVDGTAAGNGPFDLRLDCAAQLPATLIDCGQTLGTTAARPSYIEDYASCGGAGFYHQAEARFRFRPPSRVLATITTPQSADFDLVALVEREAPDTCRAFADQTLVVANVNPEDHLIFVDSSTIASAPVNLSVTCTPMVSTDITCSTVTSGVTGNTSLLSDYSCSDTSLDGGEAFFSFTNPVRQSLAFAVKSPPGVDLDIAVLDGLVDVADVRCTAGGDVIARVADAPPGDYLVVVDGTTATNLSPFELYTSCGSAGLNCGAAPDLPCETLVYGDTSAGANQLTLYGRAPNIYSGREVVYHFFNPVAQPVSFLLKNAPPELDLMLMSSCDPSSAFYWGDDSLVALSIPPGDYYLVIDGRDGVSGAFELMRFCGSSWLDPPTLAASLDAGSCVRETKTLYYAPSVTVGDVILSFDLTASMQQELDQVKSNARELYNRLAQLIPSLWFGLVSFTEFNTAFTDTVCGYAHYDLPNAYPYRLHLPLTPDINQVDAVLQTINQIGGGNGETYTRTFWESYTDPNIGWRSCSRRVWISLGDEPPMDCNYLACVGGNASTGRDPGPDMVPGNADDIELLPTIDEMNRNCISLVPIDSSDDPVWNNNWDCLARRTGGQMFALHGDGTVPNGLSLVDGLVDIIVDAVRTCPELRVEATGPYAAWVTVTPASIVNAKAPLIEPFTIDFCVPAGTPPGTYPIGIVASCPSCCGPLVLGSQAVSLEVTDPCAVMPAAVATTAPICAGGTAVLDASASIACGPSGLEYQWLEGTTPICPWSAVPTCAIAPLATTTYTLAVRCVGTTCEAGDDVVVEVADPPIANAGADASVCELTPVLLSAVGSAGSGCAGGMVYEWRDGATVVRPWSPDPTFVPPTTTVATTTYTVVVACAVPVAADCTTSDDVTVAVRSCPLAVRFEAFAARWIDDASSGVARSVGITWRTAFETDIVLFAVERAPTAHGPFEQLPPLTAPHGAGMPYEVIDASPPPGTPWYRVVEHTTSGRGEATPALQVQDPARKNGARSAGRRRGRGAVPRPPSEDRDD